MATPRLNAFLVEDNATVCQELAETLLELANVRVVGACAAEAEALRWLHERPHAWDLLIVDLFLKAGSGLHLLQALQRSSGRQKIAVFSNYVTPAVRKRCAQLGVDAVFDKSTEIDALLDYCVRQATLRAADPPAGSA